MTEPTATPPAISTEIGKPMTLIEFLRAQLDDEEREAKAAQDVRSDYHAWHHVIDLREQGMDERDALHVVTHRPARVLAEVDAKRQITNAYADALRVQGGFNEAPKEVGAREALELACRALALPYADHPEFRAEWRP